jgi:hypothetical protein
MIKFTLFDTANSYQCHFAEISTFVVSIAHYMRAYFNYQALIQGRDFQLPSDASLLNVRYKLGRRQCIKPTNFEATTLTHCTNTYICTVCFAQKQF